MDHRHGLHRHPTTLHSLLSSLPTRSPLVSHSLGLTHTALSAPNWLPRLALSQTLGDAAGSDALPSSHDPVPELYGASGCINSLAWSGDGQRLAAAGDDTKVCIWQAGRDYEVQEGASGPVMGYGLESSWETGHRANIFSVKWAPHKNDRIITAAGDSEVRVFDLSCSTSGSAQKGRGHSWTHNDSSACTNVIRCHTGRVKRVAVEDSPDVFLTVSEDGTVRQHDLRTTHACRPLGSYERAAGCPPPLASYPGLTLYSLSVSLARPHLFAVGGRNPFAYLHDRRMVKLVEEEWGVELKRGAMTQCVRRFAPPADEGLDKDARSRGVGKNTLVSAKLDRNTGRDLLVSYSGGKVYMFSVDGVPQEVEKEAKEQEGEGAGEGGTKRARSAALEDDESESKRRGSSHAPAGMYSTTSAPRTKPSTTATGASPNADTSSDSDDDEPIDLDAVVAATVDDYAEQFGEEEGGGEQGEEESSSGSSAQENDWSDDDGDQPLYLGQSDHDEEEDDEDDDEDEEDEPEIEEVTDEEESDEGLPSTFAYRAPPRQFHQQIPLVLPRREFSSHTNRATVKEVGYAFDESCVVSGSDDGNLFIWEREGEGREGKLVGVLEGDGQVVNVIESNPHLPCLAVSGIDSTVKLFTPAATVEAANCANKVNDPAQLERIQAGRGLEERPDPAEFLRMVGGARLAALNARVGGGRQVRVVVDGEEQDCVVM